MITKQQALTADRFEHASLTNRDGTPLRARRNGKTQIWKTRPDEFKIPCKYGFYNYLYIHQYNAMDWNVAN